MTLLNNAPILNRQNKTNSHTLPDFDVLIESSEKTQCDVLVIGAGLAGLSTALSLPNHLQITILAKEDWQECSSNYAQGGIAAVIDTDDSVKDHVQDTLIAGDGLCDSAATTQILAQGGDAIQWLLQNEVPFTNNSGSTTCKNLRKCHFFVPTQLGTADVLACADLHLTQEGGHGRRRVAHADDATGKHIMTALHTRVQQAAHITLLPYHEALSLIVDEGTCQGASVYNTQADTVLTIYSDAIVLASGGLGQLFSRATAPSVCVGDGLMMAWEAGCRLANLEFIQFHPTGLVYNDANGASNFLISEAVRGEGGYLLCPLTGERFMPHYDVREELAPRDIVARAIANEIAQNKLGYVHLDISHQPKTFIKTHFPDIYSHCLTLGIDITKQPIPVAPTAHYTCGGVMTNAIGQTDVKGLYAAGEVAHTGLHGANRLASNSLLECVVVGREVAAHIPKYLANSCHWIGANGVSNAGAKKASDVDSANDALAMFAVSTSYSKPCQDGINALNIPTAIIMSANQSPYPQRLTQLKQLMTQHMGIRRDHADLSNALNQVLAWKTDNTASTVCTSTVSASQSPLSSKGSADISADIAAKRWQRLLSLTALLLQSALAREESRGGHARNDFPNPASTAKISVVYPLSFTNKALINLITPPSSDGVVSA